ncbi:UDP-glucosyltransferase 2-like [Galleria mellonella]|uniref:UDP-glucosyltransferase 2-like n=1 Tax=Galleria mellonella TaxID=7137 RepID=A0ABM3N0A3_GALME|nr:UDP-glucosyltransferase 2-like [Galleria mellonella]
MPSLKAAKILAVYPTQSISHQVVFRPLVRELAPRGHEVVVITPALACPVGEGLENLTEIDIRQYHDKDKNRVSEMFNMELKVIVYLYCSYRVILYTEAVKILAVFPTPSISHQVVFRPFVRELAARGHEVVVITPAPAYPADGSPMNLTEIDVKQVSQIYKEEKIRESYSMVNEYADIRMSVKRSALCILSAFYEQINTDAASKIIRDKNIEFDLLIIEAWFQPLLAFSHRFNVPVIWFSSVGSFHKEYQVVGGFSHPLFHPSFLCSRCPNIENLTNIEKIYEIYNYIYIHNWSSSFKETEINKLRTFFGSEMPSLIELSDNVHLYMRNVHCTWELNRPVPSSVVQVGGIHIKSECTLPEITLKKLICM